MNLNLRFVIPSLFFLGLCLTISTGWREFSVAAAANFNQTDDAFAKREAAYRANNIGVARLEQFEHKAAVEDFRRALALDPQLKIAQINLAIALFNTQDLEAALPAAETAAKSAPESLQPIYILGLIARTQNRTEEAEKYFRRILESDPQDTGANVNIGQIYIQQRQYKEAVEYLRRALDAEPYNVTAMYNLATALVRSGAREEGQQLMTRFQSLRQSGAATNIGLTYLEQGRYAEAVSSTGAESELVDKTKPKNIFQNVDVGLPSTGARSRTQAAGKSDNSEAAAVLFDLDNDGDLDFAQVSAALAKARLFVNNGGKFTDGAAIAGDLNKISTRGARGVVAGDYDNDMFADLLVFGKGQPFLLKGDGKGGFQNVTAAAKIPALTSTFNSGALVDADHDGDLDIFLGGFGAANSASAPAESRLLRNNGDGTFTDISETAKINLLSRAVAVVPTDFDNRRDVDLLVLNSGADPYLFRNLRDGSFRDVAGEVGLSQLKDNWTCAAVGDFNKDSYVDFFFGRTNGAGVFAISDGRGKFAIKTAPTGTENALSAQFLDYDDDGLLDLIVHAPKGFVVSRNLGGEWTKAGATAFKVLSDASSALTATRNFLSGDTDGDGDLDLIALGKNGSAHLLQNSGNDNKSEVLQLQGRVSNRTGVGAKIDLRSGSLSQKLETYAASPAPAPSQVHFGLGKRAKPDAVRVIWSSGVVQAEIDFPDQNKSTAKNSTPFKIEELDRKPSSCPYLYTWNGERFEFVTDFLGGGEMGNWQERGAYHYPDSDEFVRITSDQLKPRDGKYEIRVTNELEEVLYLDYLKLVAIEHDANAEVYPNEGLGIPTAGRRILYTTRAEHAPLAATNSKGENVLPKIERLDRTFYDDFTSQKIRGYADEHALMLNLDDKKGFRGRTLLLLTGWTDYAFSSDNIAASQSGKALFMPKLQVKNARGAWETVIDSIGISVGRPQTVVVDLTGKFLTDSREVRIVTNFKTYWDKISVDTSEQTELKTFDLAPARADLAERGFSEEIKFGEMIAANYDKILNDGRWKYFSGSFTKTGAVNPLLAETDDVFVISKTGDELTLSFNALPAPPAGKKYTFLLYADGYSKEMDINSGSPDAVLPLPFKKMKKYPYAETDEQYPMSDEKQRLYDEYTTRTVKGLLPRIEASFIN